MSLNLFKFVHDKVQEKKLRKLAKKCETVPENLPTILQNPDIVTLILKYLKGKDTDDEMLALLFDWNQAGFNDTNVPNCHNGVAGQTQEAIIANLLANGATDFMNLNILFIFPNGQAIGTWCRNFAANLPWAKQQAGVADICNNILRLNKITAHTANLIYPFKLIRRNIRSLSLSCAKNQKKILQSIPPLQGFTLREHFDALRIARCDSQWLLTFKSASRPTIMHMQKMIAIHHVQILLNEEPVIKYRPSFMEELELDIFFRSNGIALEIQEAQHRFHNTSWYKDIKKLKDIINYD
ncbi:6974_t:CDS:2 [Ambispora leptoticha]|uniref:6974_t:CDS:1 n=1 Tax=Ambispora leptoticha TaxID=144679 RepID=A0A9N9B710_9GLOM|nr:6974_t:CDS:2 [Ambispora leptoticha]